jgi:hypothetical protein
MKHIYRMYSMVLGMLIVSLLTACQSNPTAAQAPTQSTAASTPATTQAVEQTATIEAESTAQSAATIDFSAETVGAEPSAFSAVIGSWLISVDGDNQVLLVDGRQWQQGQTSSNLADQARALYGDRYAEFLDNVTAYAFFPLAVDNSVENFTGGDITVRFKTIEGRIDQNAGIAFNIQPNGDYLVLRASALEGNMVLWTVHHGQRDQLQWIRNVPVSSLEWHELRVSVDGSRIQGYLDGTAYVDYTFDGTVSGRIGLWSKSDSVVYFDDFGVTAR